MQHGMRSISALRSVEQDNLLARDIASKIKSSWTVFEGGDVSVEFAWSVVLVAALGCVFAASLWLDMSLNRQGFFPFISFVGAYYFVFHGLLSLYAALWVVFLNHTRVITFEPAAYITVFVMLQILVFSSLARWFPPRRDPMPVLESGLSVKLFAWICIVVSLLFDTFPFMRTLPSLPQLHQPLWLCGLGCLAYVYMTERLHWPTALVALCTLALKFFYEFHTGLLTTSVLSVAAILCAALTTQRWKVAMALGAVCVVMIAAYAYPKYLLKTTLHGQDAMLYRFDLNLSFKSLEASVNSMARRSSHSLWTAHVMEKTPDETPYSERKPLVDTLVNHIPRAFWSEKPREVYGNDFGKAYGFILQDDNLTSWNIPWTADLYITSGIVGALFKITLLTTALFIICRWLASLPERAFAFGLHTAAVFPLFQQSSNISLMAGNILIVLISLYIGYRIVDRMLRTMRARGLIAR